jgi:molybdenum cofactor biosynthesis enzyme MoaA
MKIGNKLLYLTHFITNKCNLGCRHCFYHKALNKKIKIAGINEIENIIKSLKRPLRRLVITGGEPFLYPHLSQLVLAYQKINKPKRIFIDTNGYATERIANTLGYLANKVHLPLHIQLSMDGPLTCTIT